MPRLVPVLVLALTAGVAAAQPASPAPQLVVAKVSGGSLVWGTTDVVPVTVEKAVPVIRDGQTVTEKVTVTEYRTVEKAVGFKLKELRVTDATGRAIPADRLATRLGDGAAVVLHTGPLPEVYRRVLKDDAVVVELPGRPAPQL